ncbi:MAG: GNAT family N-acetyltransferase [Nitrospira sp.]
MSSRKLIQIQDRKSKDLIDATFIDGLSQDEIDKAINVWKPAMQAAQRRMDAEGVPVEQRPQHGHWDWNKKYQRLGQFLLFQFLGVECDGEMQGLCLLQTANMFCRIPAQAGKGLVYIMFLEVAPWNSVRVVREPRYRLVGSLLVVEAIQISHSLGFNGRIGLHALQQAEDFYSKACGMDDLGPDHTHDGLRYFEMTSGQANNFPSSR